MKTLQIELLIRNVLMRWSIISKFGLYFFLPLIKLIAQNLQREN